jgi:hypothetical protein
MKLRLPVSKVRRSRVSLVDAIEGKVTVWPGMNFAETSGNTASMFVDNVAIYGVAAIPEHSTYAAILTALTLGVVAIRRRRSGALVA